VVEGHTFTGCVLNFTDEVVHQLATIPVPPPGIARQEGAIPRNGFDPEALRQMHDVLDLSGNQSIHQMAL
jgi:hypothetical protein